MHDIQLQIEKTFSKQNVVNKLRNHMARVNTLPDMDLLKEIAYISKCDILQSEEKFYTFMIETLGLLGRYTSLQGFAVRLSHSLELDMKTTYTLIDLICETDLMFDIDEPKHEGSYFMVQPTLVVDEELMNEILLTQYLPPMLVKPVPWDNTQKGGFLTHKTQFVLGNPLNGDIDVVYYGGANRLQNVEYSLIEEMLPYQTFERNDNGYSPEEVTLRTQKLMLKYGNRFYFPVRQDYRGRYYTQGHFINPQGDEQHRSVLEFANKRILTERGRFWLGIELANNYGLDHRTLQQRNEWFTRNKESLLKNSEKWIKRSEDMLLMRKNLMALRDVEAGLPTGVIIHMDSTNSALQIYSVLYSCADTARLCNVIGSDRADAYRILADKMNELLKVDFITRKHVKKAFMVHFYSAGRDTVGEKLREELGEDYSKDVLEAFYTEIDELAPAGSEGMADISASWNKRAVAHSWKLPNGFEVEALCIARKESIVDTEEFGSQNHYESVLRPTKRHTSLAPNVIHSCDGLVMDTLIALEHDISPIHDSVGAHPNDMDMYRVQYKQTLADINDSNLLSEILSDIEGKPVSIQKHNTLKSSDILRSVHAIC